MKRAYILPLLALIGLGIAISAIISGNRPASVHHQGIPVFTAPFDVYVAGTGIVEATTGDIAIGTPISGVVMEVYVRVGDHVEAGSPLFKIDDRGLQAQLLTATARVHEAAASLQKPKHKLEYAQHLKSRDAQAISEQALVELRDETQQAETALELAKAQLAQIQLELERLTVRAPLAGGVLQLRIHPGEYVEGSSVSPHLLLLGSNRRLNLRVDVDEYDAWRIRPGAEAVAFVRGHQAQKIPLRYEYTEPYIIPKTSLTGMSTERTDTRVLQVIYSFEHADLPVYTGQQLDVFIRAPAADTRETRP